jgi:hypothetical protein
MIVSAREAAGREDLYTSLSGVGTELIGAILGREWSILAFRPTPARASLSVDGALVASGVSPRLYLTPGQHVMRVSAPGYGDETRTVVLEPGKEASLAVDLQIEHTGTVEVASVPPGAALYLDSVLQGTTPLSVQVPAERSRGVLSLGGFYDLPFSLGVDSKPQLSFSLQKDIGSRDTLQKKARDDFYALFGWFAVSIPLPLISYGLYIDYRVQYLDLSIIPGMESQAAAAALRSNVFFGGYYAGLAISASLFTWMVFRIIHYVTVSNWTAG